MKPINIHKLEVKHFTLAQEARIIRRKENAARKWKKFESEGYKHLREHWDDVAIEQPDGWWKLKNGEEVNFDGSPKGLRKYAYAANRNYNPELRAVLSQHRTKIVRPEARAAHLALGFLKKMPYRAMEFIAFEPPMWDKVWQNIIKFGGSTEMGQEFLDWADAEEISVTKRNSKHNQRNLDYTHTHTGIKPPSWFIKHTLKWS